MIANNVPSALELERCPRGSVRPMAHQNDGLDSGLLSLKHLQGSHEVTHLINNSIKACRWTCLVCMYLAYPPGLVCLC